MNDDKKMYILTYDHGGFVLWGARIGETLNRAFTWLDKHPKFKTGLDFEAFTFDEMERIAPEVNQKIADALKKYEGRFTMGSSTYAQPLSLFCSDESNVRQLTYAIKTNLRLFGQTPSVYAISEFALNNQSPQMLKQCGYKMAIMRTHVMNFGYQRDFDAAYGTWVGKDGTGIPAIPTYTGDGVGYTNTTVDNWVLTRWPEDSTMYSLSDFRDMFAKYEPLLASRYDDLCNSHEAMVEDAEQHPEWTFVTLEELEGIYGAPQAELKTTDNDFHGRMPWGYCGNEIFNGLRKTETQAQLAERLNVLSAMLGGPVYGKELETAWQNALILQHHDVTICGLLDDAHRFIPDSLKASDKAIAAALADLGKVFASAECDRALVVNTNDFAVSEWVTVDAGSANAVFDGDRRLPCRLLGDQLSFLAEVPALTAVTFRLGIAEAPAAKDFTWCACSQTLTTPLYTLKLSNKGIVSLTDNKTGDAIIDNGEGKLFAGMIENEDCAALGVWTVDCGADDAHAVFNGTVGTVGVKLDMAFRRGVSRIDCRSVFDIHGEHIGRTGLKKGIHSDFTVNGEVHEEKLRFVADLCLDKSRRIKRDLPFSVSDWGNMVWRPEDFWYEGAQVLVDHEVSAEEAFGEPVYAQGVYWVALADEHRWIALSNKGCMGTAIVGNTLNVPLAYANEYFCGTRMLNGTFENEFSLLTGTGAVSDAALHRQAVSYQYAPIAAKVAAYAGTKDSYTLATVNTKQDSVLLTGIYPEDGALFARFCNFSDNAAELEFAPAGAKTEAETDLLGRETAPVADNKLTFRPWEIKTVKWHS